MSSVIGFPLVSVIVPTYNRAHLIGETIESLLSQSYNNIEIIIVSDGSTDDTEEVINTFKDDRIIFLLLKENTKKPAKVRNTGIRVARGDYIAFCDDDDIWVVTKLEVQMSFLMANPKYLAICSNCVFFPKTNFGGQKIKALGKVKNWVIKKNIIKSSYLLLTMNFVINSSMVMKNVTKELGLLNELEAYAGSEDFEYWLRLSELTNIYYLDEVLVKYRVHENQLISVEGSGKKTFLKIIGNYNNSWGKTVLIFLRQAVFRLAKV